MAKYGECPLCLSYAELNQEHLNAEWTRLVIRERVPSAVENLPRQPKRKICTSCNSRMGAAFEDKGKPVMRTLIGAYQGLLGPAEQLLAARWLFKHTLVWGLTHRPEDLPPGIAPEMQDAARQCLDDLIDGSEPNFAGSMRIGAIMAADVAMPAVEPYSVGPVGASSPTFMEVSHLGWLMFESVIMPMPEDPDEIPVFGINQDERLIQIWPIVHPMIVWPPRRPALTMSDMLALRDAWGILPATTFNSKWATDLGSLITEHQQNQT